MRQLPWLFLLAFTALTVFGCSTTGLPDYAAPSVSVVDDGELDLSDVISYRKLSRSDFKGSKPPTHFDERMAAVTCVYTQPIVDKDGIQIESAITADGREVYDITYSNLSYKALMNRNCSWWNTKSPGVDPDYVLEHEQIHFALFEIAAREWSDLPAQKFQVKADDAETMKRELKAQFERRLEQRLKVLLAQNRQFDEETSLGHNPEKQREWVQLVRSRLPFDHWTETTSPQAYCQISDAATASIARARAALADARDPAAVMRLIEQAESASAAPECDNVRARILADKALQMVTEARQ